MAKAIREVYGETIKKYGERIKDIVVLDAGRIRFYQICYVWKRVSGPFL